MTQPTTVVPLPATASPIGVGSGVTHRGCVRDRNEDSILIDPSGRLWAVADGMGGYGHGDVASDIVIDCLSDISDEDEPAAALGRALAEANAAIAARGAERGIRRMGATVVAMVLARGRAHIAWLGDCRAYLYRGGQLRLVTHDHTVVQDLVDTGAIRPADAERHPEAHIVTRAVGVEGASEPDLEIVPVFPGDRILLCSDGLIRVLFEPEIADVLARCPEPEPAAAALLRAAIDAGAPDNVSAIVVAIRSC
jgi:PPM family protein phosphatase